MKEYERTSTTVVNGYLLPGDAALSRQSRPPASRGSASRAPLLVVASNGGVVGARQAAERPVFVVGSGPAAGVAGAARLGAALGEPNLIAFDMGGTTAKASLVEYGQPTAHHRVRVPRGHQHVEPLHQGRRLHAQGAGHRHRRGRHRAPARSRGSTRAASCAWGRVGGRAAGPRVLRHRRHRADRHGRQRRAGLPQPGAPGGRRAAAPGRARARGDRAPRRQRRCGSRSRRPRAGSATSPTPAWRARSARSPSSAGATRATSRWWPSAGAGPSTRATWRRPSTSAACSCPSLPASSPPSGMLASDVTHHFVRAAGGALEDAATLGRARTALDELSAEALATLAGEGYPRERVADRGARPTCATRARRSELVIPIPGGRLEGARLRRLREAFDREYAATYGYCERRAARARERPRGGHGTPRAPARLPQRADRRRRRTPARSAGRSHWARGEPPVATP